MKPTLSLIVLLMTTPAFAQDAPLPARVAAQKMTLPPGFQATLFAGEPDVVQPIAFCFDDRGRVWVAECLSYPKWDADAKNGKDRIVILEDTDGDGVHDKRTVFADNIQNISGIQYGFGGVWVCATPNLLFIPIKEVGQAFQPDKGDEKRQAGKPDLRTVPAGPHQIVLDGWDIKARHNVFNSPTWGPDGWLYGCNGILSNSRVGAPGTPDKDRVALNCGVWRYHPTKKKFEAVAHGTTNPWGLDFDEHGEMFITNCVIDHLWHIVPGGHYQRMFGDDLNPHVYKLMPSICDHLHWGGGSWTSSRRPLKVEDSLRESSSTRGASAPPWEVHSAAGGGHAHVGCMIYLGDNWPDRYRGGVFMCNLHGNRINHDILERNGSTYVARHAKDFMHANDPWFRGLAIHYGPDGGVYVSDWTDTGECHNYQVADKTNGRIFKITYGKARPFTDDLAKLSDEELAKLQWHKNEWMSRHARRLLQERAEKGMIDLSAIDELERQMKHQAGMLRLSTFWAMRAIKRLDQDKLIATLKDPYPYVRAWALRYLVEDHPIEGRTRDAITDLAKREPSPLVRLHVASVLTRSDNQIRMSIGAHLVEHANDTNDPYLSLMYWHALAPALDEYGSTTFNHMETCRIPLLREYIARRYTETKFRGETAKGNRHFETLLDTIVAIDDPALHRDFLRGIHEGLSARRNVPMPSKKWKDAYPILIESPLPEVRERALALAVQFGDERAFTLLRKIVPDRAQTVKQREDALKTLLFQQKADLVPMLHELLSDETLRGPAIRGLAAFDHAQTPALLLRDYAKWNADEKGDVIQTLSARAGYVKALVSALEAKAVPRADINSYTIRQLHTVLARSGDKATTAALTKIVGEIRPASADKEKLMAKYKAELKPDVLKKANLSNGRAIYAKSCASCHRLFGEGGDIGPDLTGAQRTNLDYILENVLDPSAIVPREYQVTVIATTNGRTLSGMVRKETDAALTLQTQNEMIVIPKGEIDMRTATKVSMMPEGAFDQMRIEEVRDLVGYLGAQGQVGLKK